MNSLIINRLTHFQKAKAKAIINPMRVQRGQKKKKVLPKRKEVLPKILTS
jgi:hypothetical protein